MHQKVCKNSKSTSFVPSKTFNIRKPLIQTNQLCNCLYKSKFLSSPSNEMRWKVCFLNLELKQNCSIEGEHRRHFRQVYCCHTICFCTHVQFVTCGITVLNILLYGPYVFELQRSRVASKGTTYMYLDCIFDVYLLTVSSTCIF